MRFRDSLAINISPICLRLVLGVTFLWAGYGKVFVEAPYTAEQIATLDAMSAPAIPDEPSTEVIENAVPETDPDPSDIAIPEAPIPDPDAGSADDDADTGTTAFIGEQGFRVITVQDEGEYDDAEAPDMTERKKVYYLALMLEGAATPDENGDRMLPRFIGQGEWPIRFAWLAAFTELVGGAFILFGFLTRLSAVGIASTMLMALWMTNIGPVVMLGAPSSLGFLPDVNDFAVDAWRGMLWQFSLLGASIAVLLAGPGSLSADRVLLGRRASKNAKPTAKPKHALDDE